MKLVFKWDDRKAKLNLQKHGIQFFEAVSVFQDELSITIVDSSHSRAEERFIEIGRSTNGQLLIVVYTERDNHIRIISCRKATAAERKNYETKND